MRLDLSPGDIAALVEHTEGWAVGLQEVPQTSRRGRFALALWKPDAEGAPRSHPFIVGYRVGCPASDFFGSR